MGGFSDIGVRQYFEKTVFFMSELLLKELCILNRSAGNIHSAANIYLHGNHGIFKKKNSCNKYFFRVWRYLF